MSNCCSKFVWVPLIILLSSFFITEPSAEDTTFYELLRVLKNNGTLSAEEYKSLIRAPKSIPDTDSEVFPNKNAIAPFREEKWADKIQIKGNVRIRYQYNHIQNRQINDNNAPNSRHRGRIRGKIGMVTTPLIGWEGGIGLTSGSENPRGSNADLGDTFSTKELRLDYAYIERKTESVSFVAGKFNRDKYLWNPTDLMWDKDIKPEGVSAHFARRNDLGTLWTNSGIWMLNEQSSSSEDPYLVYAQVGQHFNTNPIAARVAGTTYVYADLNKNSIARTFKHSSNTNEDNNLNAIQLSGEISYLLGGSELSIISDMIKNIESDNGEDFAYSIGFQLARPPWKFKYIYAKLEHNSIPDFLPDSDRFNGHTGIKGHESELQYIINKNLLLGIDFYSTEDYDNDIEQKILQADLLLKF